ncbi:S8 family serine peptidase [Acetobacterium fimetarium]|uniref:S8 family serine peptidase n=1 Tax=Acetobacterium fimetarium TaxID=52691 RepID=A0ABR6WS55_9FIRM|nr:S8 family peptidase [Acetobacterium fimetarium]MBC3803348.1 S8 family serine peptidase [Acetobacterium fimetarium]
MAKEKHPILAHGELYVEPIVKKKAGGPKKIPHEYQDAKLRILDEIDKIHDKIISNAEVFMKEKIICVRMEPKFEAKSYVPTALIQSNDSMKIVGGRKYNYFDGQGEQISAKLYFIKTNDMGIRNLRSTLESGSRDNIETWRNQIGSIHSLDLLEPDEKVMGFEEKWDHGSVEIVLHPLGAESDDLLKLFYETSNIAIERTKVRRYEDGLIFISANCSKNEIEKIKKINPLRAIHPLGRVDIAPIREATSENAPQIKPSQHKSNISVGVFDGGADVSVPLLNGYVNANDCVETHPDLDYISHGTGVCGVVLHGNLAGKSKNDLLEVPCLSIESYRVLPLKNESDFELYEAIDAIEQVVKTRNDLKLFNLSFGPIGAIVDDSISRFTYVLDRLTYDVPEGETNPLFCVAVGNDGDLGFPFNRIQSPSDMVNGLGVGAYTIDLDGEKQKASYSCIGGGREGAKIKPDFLEFGGSIDRPFVLVGTKPNTLAASAGTSFASPLVVNKIGTLMAHSENIEPHLGRTLLIHNAERACHLTQEDQGYGFCPDNVHEILTCEDKKVTILYSGTLEPKQTVQLPVFAPHINRVAGNVTISWTITTIVDPFVNDPDAYTNNCIEDVFIPHEMTFNFSKYGHPTKKLNLLKKDSIIQASELLDNGYKKSNFPVSHPSKKYWEETDLRATDLKWDTVISKYQRMRGASLLNPAITLHAIGRNDFDARELKYFVAVSIEAPNFEGSLYDTILQNYQNLAPIEIRNINRIMVNAN